MTRAMEIMGELRELPDRQTGIVRGYAVTRMGSDFRAIGRDGYATAWWRVSAMGYIIDNWMRHGF